MRGNLWRFLGCGIMGLLLGIIVMGWLLLKNKKKAKQCGEELINQISNNIDMVMLVYSPIEKKVIFVTDSVSWMLGIRKEHIYQDIRYLFEKLIIVSEEKNFMRDFLDGNIILSAQKECEIIDMRKKQNRWGYLKIVPRDDGSYLLTLTDATVEHELSNALLASVNTLDDVRRKDPDLVLSSVEKLNQEQENKSVFEEPVSAFQREEEHMTEVRYKNKRVLVVEDNAINMDTACQILKGMGVEIDKAVNGEEAVRKFQNSWEDYYDLVFMDIQMPVMDGNEATKKIRAMERRDAKVIPIVAMTAYIFTEDIRASIQAGMDMHIAKPLNTQKLSDVMKKYLAN
ncbi:MAG: response regulator [Eubacterium sp.]|jgi:CheY-like chemotaxis protein|nr:response regulator [Eubacterium sp.]